MAPILPYVQPQITAYFERQTGQNVNVTFDSLTLDLDLRQRHVEVEANGVALVENGKEFARLDRAFFRVNQNAQRNPQLSPVILSGLEVDIVRQRDGTITVNDVPTAKLAKLTGLARVSGAAVPPPILITGVRANFLDEPSAVALPFVSNRIDIITLSEATEIFGVIRVKEGEFVGSEIMADLILPRDGTQRTTRLELSELDLSRLESTGLFDLLGTDLTGLATGSVTLNFDESFKMTRVLGDIGVRDGGVSGADLPQELIVTSLEGQFDFDPTTDLLTVTDLIASGDIWSARLGGTAQILTADDGTVTGFNGELTAFAGTLNAPDVFEESHQFNAEGIPFLFSLAPFAFSVDRAPILVNGVAVLVEGTTTTQDDQFAHRYRILSEVRAVEDIIALWPKMVIPNTRKWAKRALKKADLRNIDAAISRVGQDTSVRLNFDFDGLDAQIIRDFPALSHASGRAQLTETDFTVEVDQGTVYLPKSQGGVHGVEIADSQFYVPDISVKPAKGEAIIRPKTTLDGVFAVLDHKPFGFLTDGGVQVPKASGLVAGDLKIDLPLKPKIGVEDVALKAIFTISQFLSDDIVAGRSVKADRIEGESDGASLRLSGPVTMDELPAQFEFHEIFGVQGETSVTVRTQLTQELATAFLVPEDYLKLEGGSPLTVTVNSTPNLDPTFRAVSNLKGLAMYAPQIAWRKRADDEARLEATGTFLKDGIGAVSFTLNAKGLDAAGVLDGETTKITSAKIGNWFEGAATFGASGGPFVKASRIDLRNIPKSLAGGQAGDTTTQISVDRMVVTDQIYLTDVQGAIVPGRIDEFTGLLNDRAAINVFLKQSPEGPIYTVTGRNAGRALGVLDIIEAARDGDFEVEIKTSGPEYIGKFELKNIRLRNSSTAVALLDAISLVSLVQQLNGPGLRFETVRGRFRIAESGIEIDGVSAVGASLGFTTAGIYLPDRGTLDLEGTVTPLYPINGAFERTFKKPFGRERGEGLFSFTYRMRGPAAEPKVRVNPISILLPGALRELVRPKTPRLENN
ncbi:MAG: AsmA-like C-terminal region-containing protein [Pseudomonadota bacterium]